MLAEMSSGNWISIIVPVALFLAAQLIAIVLAAMNVFTRLRIMEMEIQSQRSLIGKLDQWRGDTIETLHKIDKKLDRIIPDYKQEPERR